MSNSYRLCSVFPRNLKKRRLYLKSFSWRPQMRHTHTHTHTRTRTRINTHTRTHTNTHTHTRTHAVKPAHTPAQKRTHAHTHTLIHTNTRTYTHGHTEEPTGKGENATLCIRQGIKKMTFVRFTSNFTTTNTRCNTRQGRSVINVNRSILYYLLSVINKNDII